MRSLGHQIVSTPTWGLLDGPVIAGDCVNVMRAMPPGSVDAIVTDPPYGIGFMGHEWDQPGEFGAVRKGGGGPRGHTPNFKRRPGANYGFDKAASAALDAGRYDFSLTANQRFQAWCEAWAGEALRILKPGGHLLVFGGTRTYHRMACGIEDAGFEIRDSLIWIYGSGFPKSKDVALAIDKAQGAADRGRAIPVASTNLPSGRYAEEKLTNNPVEDYEPASEDAKAWDGWGTAMKPAHEPIVVARKPLAGTVAGNVLKHGTGALNIDGCRIEGPNAQAGRTRHGGGNNAVYAQDDWTQANQASMGGPMPAGRWPANLMLSHAEDCVSVGTRRVRNRAGSIDPSTGPRENAIYGIDRRPRGEWNAYGDEDGMETVEAWECVPGCPITELDAQSGDSGASRFFYCSKPSSAERNAGLANFEPRRPDRDTGHTDGRQWDIPGSKSQPRANVHPTVKPLDLMRWLVRLVTPPGGVVLDPFTGSGTTGCATLLEGFSFVGIEREAAYVAIAEARIAWWREHPEGMELTKRLTMERTHVEHRESGQATLFGPQGSVVPEEAGRG